MVAAVSSRARELIELALEANALALGEFTLKSGRPSPYFLNLGKISTGKTATRLAFLYADALIDQQIEVATLFGPAYKGITLAALTAASLAQERSWERELEMPTDGYRQVGFAYSRKEAKDHGEGGLIVGELKDPVVIIDDVITAGTATEQVIQQLAAAGVEVAGLIVAFDRMERSGESKVSAAQQIADKHSISVLSLATAVDLMEILNERGQSEPAERIKKHLAEYGSLA